MSAAGELVRIVKLDTIPQGVQTITATPAECAALAHRFGIADVRGLRAEVTLEPDGREIAVTGTLVADIDQHCAVSGDIFANRVEESIDLRFVPARRVSQADAEGEAIELDSDALDEIEFTGDAFDLGEALAQSLGLAIDPYATGPGADEARRAAGLLGEDAPSGPFAALAKWKDGLASDD